MKLKKIIAMGVILSMTVLLFAGCGKKETANVSETGSISEAGSKNTGEPEIIEGKYGITDVVSPFSNDRAWVTYSSDGVTYLAMIDTEGKIIYQIAVPGGIHTFDTLNKDGKNYGVYTAGKSGNICFIDPDGKETKTEYDTTEWIGTGTDYILVKVQRKATGEAGVQKLDVSGKNITPGEDYLQDQDLPSISLGEDIFFCNGPDERYFYNARENTSQSNPDGYYMPVDKFSGGETYAYFENTASIRAGEKNDMHGKVDLYRITTDMLKENTGQLNITEDPVTLNVEHLERLNEIRFDSGIFSLPDADNSESYLYYDTEGKTVSWTDEIRSWDFWKDAVMSDDNNSPEDAEAFFNENAGSKIKFGYFKDGYALVALEGYENLYITLIDPQGKPLYTPVQVDTHNVYEIKTTGQYVIYHGDDGTYRVVLPDGTDCRVGEDDLSAVDEHVLLTYKSENGRWDEVESVGERGTSGVITGGPVISGGYIFMNNPDGSNTCIIRSVDNTREIRGIDLAEDTGNLGEHDLADSTTVTRNKTLTEADVDIEQEYEYLQDPNGQFSSFPAKTLCDENGFTVRLVAVDAEHFWLWVRNNNTDNKSARFKMESIAINGFTVSRPGDGTELQPGESKVIAADYTAEGYWKMLDALNEPASRTPMEKISLMYAYAVGKDSEETMETSELLSDNYSEEALAQLYGKKVADLSYEGKNFTAYQMDTKIGAMVYFQNNSEMICKGFHEYCHIGEETVNGTILPDEGLNNLPYILPGCGKAIYVEQSAQDARIEHEISNSSPVEVKIAFDTSEPEEYEEENGQKHNGDDTLKENSVTVNYAE